MGMFDWLTNLHRLALSVFLGFAAVAWVSMAFLAGRGRRSYTDADHVWGPIENHADWVREAHAPIPLFLWYWIVLVIGWAVLLTAIVIWHGYYY